jgi:hypothetical protein
MNHLHLPAALAAWGTPAFADMLKRELATQAAALPLQQAAATTSTVLDTPPEIMLIAATAAAERLDVRVGVFFSGIVAGCSCADDPTPVEAQPEYCELILSIDRITAGASVALPANE